MEITQSSDVLALSERHLLREDSAAAIQAAKVWIVLPAYNEEESLPALLDAVEQAMADQHFPYEVVVVDDGSRDATAEIASKRSFTMPVMLKQHHVNMGLGPTLRDGLMAACEESGPRDIIVTMDADNTHPPGLIARMVQAIQEGHDVVIASRFQRGARVIGVPIFREWLSIGARALFTCVFPTRGVRDYTCGYRAYRAAVLRQAFARYGNQLVAEAGFSCMCDVLLKLRRMGVIFGEVPLILRYDQKGGLSKMRVLRTIGKTLSLLARARFGQS